MTLCSAAGKLLDTMSFTYFFIEDSFIQFSLSLRLVRGKEWQSPIHSLYCRFGRSRASIDIVSIMSIDVYRSRSINIVSFLSIDSHIIS
ncbi:hypothetical protein DY000_02048476 [Brassica cretica]|uniref:Uncharacterized protein n=1 Tax=Brassica cretica TaxID=69181 RepID=A0ABQ7ESM2_BRACR|nr:hypothetical protein DY000_02048476 [Brassica cretica]